MIRKIGQIIRRGPGTWLVRIYGGRDPETRRRRYIGKFIHGGLPNIRLYDLRHTAATLALVAGVSPKVVSEQLGHASMAFTLEVYSHVLPHMQDAAAMKVEALLMAA